jgi:hypothetical protein
MEDIVRKIKSRRPPWSGLQMIIAEMDTEFLRRNLLKHSHL